MNFNTNYSWLGAGSGLNLESVIQSLVKIEKKPISKLQAQASEAQSRIDMLGKLKGITASLLGSTQKLNFKSTGTGLNVLSGLDGSVRTHGTFANGSHSLNVRQLSTKKIIESDEFNDGTGPKMSGKMQINDKIVTFESSDNLRTIADKINSAGAGVKANAMSVNGKYKLQLTTEASGSGANLAITDFDGIASQLGLVDGEESEAATGTGGLNLNLNLSGTNIDPNTKLSDIFGTNRITVIDQNAKTLSATATLKDLANDLANSFTKGKPVSVKVGSSETYQGFASAQSMFQTILRDKLDQSVTVTGDMFTTPTITKALISLGTGSGSGTNTEAGSITATSEFKNVVQEGQNAIVEFDGQTFTSSTNRFDVGTGKLTVSELGNFSFTSSTDRIDVTGSATSVSDFASSYNALVDFVNANSKLDSKTFSSGALFGDQQVAGLVQNIRKSLEDAAGGTSLTQLGVSFDSEGRMSVDQTKLQAALDGENTGLAKIFGSDDASSAGKLEAILSGATAYGTGLIPTMEAASKRDLEDAQSQIKSVEARVASKESLLRAKYKAMDDAVKRASSQQNQLSSFLSGMNGSYGNSGSINGNKAANSGSIFDILG